MIQIFNRHRSILQKFFCPLNWHHFLGPSAKKCLQGCNYEVCYIFEAAFGCKNYFIEDVENIIFY